MACGVGAAAGLAGQSDWVPSLNLPGVTNTLWLVPKSEPLLLPHPTVGLGRPTQRGLEVAWEMGGGQLAGMTRLFRVALSVCLPVCLGSVSFSSKTLTQPGRPCPSPGVRPPANPSPEDTLRGQAPRSSHSLLGFHILTRLLPLGCGGWAPALLGGCREAPGTVPGAWGCAVRLQLGSPLGTPQPSEVSWQSSYFELWASDFASAGD